MKIVVIGPDPQVAEAVGLSMRIRWPDSIPFVAVTAEEGFRALVQAQAHVVILQADLPNMSMAKVLQRLKAITNAPVLVLGKGGEAEVVTALETGADDYIRLPIDLIELMARVWAILRRTADTNFDGERPILSGDLLINPLTFQVYLGNRELDTLPDMCSINHPAGKGRHYFAIVCDAQARE